MPKSKENDKKSDSVRLDKWLWAARFYKTRSLARDMINGGKVHYNGARSKSSKLVELGATIKLARGYDEMTIVVKSLNDQRRGAPEAQLMYEETQESTTKREERSEARKQMQLYAPRPESKPDKKQRRQLVNFKHQQSE